MQKFTFSRFQGMFAGTAVVVLMILLTACSGVSNGQQSTTGTTVITGTTPTTTTATQGSSTATQQPSPTAQTVAFKAGGISFIGPVTNITSTSLVMKGPDNQSYTMAITAQTDLSAYSGGRPTNGSSVDMDSTINPDGSLAATTLKPSRLGDPDLGTIAYTGITTSAVGADRMIHFTAGIKSYTFTIPASAVLTDFNGNAQAIGNNVSVKVKVLYPALTVVSVGNAAA